MLEAEEHVGRVQAWLDGGGWVHEGQVDGHLVPTPYQAKGPPSDSTKVPALDSTLQGTTMYHL